MRKEKERMIWKNASLLSSSATTITNDTENNPGRGSWICIVKFPVSRASYVHNFTQLRAVAAASFGNGGKASYKSSFRSSSPHPSWSFHRVFRDLIKVPCISLPEDPHERDSAREFRRCHISGTHKPALSSLISQSRE